MGGHLKHGAKHHMPTSEPTEQGKRDGVRQLETQKGTLSMPHGKQVKTRGKTSALGTRASGWGSSPLSSTTSCRPRPRGSDSQGEGWQQPDVSSVWKSRGCQGAGVMKPSAKPGMEGTRHAAVDPAHLCSHEPPSLGPPFRLNLERIPVPDEQRSSRLPSRDTFNESAHWPPAT